MADKIRQLPVSYTHLDVYKRQLLYGDVVCPSVEPESPIRELFCCDCHAVPPESFLTFNMLIFRRNGWFL